MAPAAIVATGPSVVVGAGAAAVLVVPAVLLRRRRWVLWVSATLLILIAASAVTPPLTGLGQLSQTEMVARVAMGERPDVAAGHRSGVMGFVPFDDVALLLIGAAFTAAAVLLLILEWLVHRPQTGPREVLPVRWRVSLTLWGIALALVSIPYAIFLFSSTTAEYFMAAVTGSCPGFMTQMRVGILLSPLNRLPQPAVIAVGFGVWALLARKGHRRWGRAVGWVTVIPLAWYGATSFALAGLDAVAGDRCARAWSEMYDPGTIAWLLNDLLAAVLIIVAVRVRRAPRPYRSSGLRIAAALAVVLLLVTVPRTDAPVGKAAAADSRAYDSRAFEQSETTRYTGDQQPQADNLFRIMNAHTRCAELPKHRPLIRASRTDRAALWVGFGSLNAYENDPGDDFPALDHAFTNNLVGSAPGQLTILPADEVGHVCVTAEAYRRRPPVELQGWERVVEVGYQSTNGDLSFSGDEGGATLKNLAINGPGHYRVRVHMRGAEAALEEDGDARQEFLIIVYPGKSERTALLK